jgi:peptidyl-prolyl cis-trans isomerase A (cyclophilin A)
MPFFPRPTDLESFTLRAPAFGAVALLAALIGCQAPPNDASKADPGKVDPGKVDPGKAPATQAAGSKAPEPGAAPAMEDDGCCRYCFDGSPCGDECLAPGKTCKKPEGEGCACTEDKYRAREFPKDYQLPPQQALVRPEVWNYNKAQGDPIEGPFTLEMAFEGAPELADTSKGKLTAVFKTSMGSFECELYEKQAPLTVANFVGLARGVRPFKDPRDRRATEWKQARYYDGTIFHRVIADFMVQGGDPTKNGTGTPGYFIPDEFDPKLRHSGPGYLSMANRNPYDPTTQKPLYDEKTGLTRGNTGSAQFFVTVRATMPLNDRHTIFGKCETEVPIAISKVSTVSHPIPDKPREDVVIETIDFVRK